MLEQKTKGRARARLAVFFVCILAVHVVGLMALLTAAGCKREQAVAPAPDTNAVLPVFEATNVVAETNLPVMPVVTPPGVTPPVVQPTPAPGGMTEYVVVKGDSFYTIGKKFGVSMKAIQDANPGVDPAKLQIGQKLVIPAPAARAESATGQPLTASGETVYTVKSGDTLTKIAAEHGTTIRALRAANDLKTDKIKVGQKLKIPTKAVAPAPMVPAEPVPVMPVPPSAPATPPAR